MQRKVWCALVTLLVSVGFLAAAEGKQVLQVDKSYPGLVLKVDDAKHTLFIRCKSPDGKFAQKSLAFSDSIKLTNFKPGVRYTFFEAGGKVVAFQPIASPLGAAVAATAPKQVAKPAQPVVKATTPPAKPATKATTPPAQPQTTPLTTAVAEVKKVEQAKIAAIARMKAKATVYQAAAAKFESAKKSIESAEKGHVDAIQIVKTQDAAVKMAEFHVFCANLESKRAAAAANLADAKLAMAQAEAAQAKAAAKVATAHLALAKVDAANFAEAKTFAMHFEKSKAVAVTTAYNVYKQAQEAMAKAFGEQRSAQGFVQQLTTAFEKAQARVNQLRNQQQKAQQGRIQAKK